MLKWLAKAGYLFFIFLLFFCNSKASGDTLYYSGKIIVSKKISFNYNLRFAINAKSEITGYSLTDAGGANETKVKITGFYDSLKGTVRFEETKILRTKVNQQQNDLCFVKATLVVKTTRILEMLSGKFSGFKPNTDLPCAGGEIKLVNAKPGQSIRMPSEKNSAPAQVKEDTRKPIAEWKDSLMTVANDKGIDLPFTGNNVKITIWDAGKIDGDRVSIMLNNLYLAKDYTLDSTRKIITAQLTGNAVDTIRLIALNEGQIPPNTAMIRIESSTQSYPIEVRAAINEIREIYLKKNHGHVAK